MRRNNMNDVKPTKAWIISLLVGSICSLIIIFSRIIGIDLPDFLRRILGIAVLIALPVMVFSSIRMYKEAKNG